MEAPNIHYSKFFARFSEIDSLPLEQWKLSPHFVAYIAAKFKSMTNKDYKFRFNKAQPSACFEVFLVKALGIKLSSNPTILKHYIDWAFDYKIKKSKRTISSINFLLLEDLLSFYKSNVYVADNVSNISRSAVIPEKFSHLLNQFNIKTYGDLAFAVPNKEQFQNLDLVINEMEKLGFDFSILERIV